MSEIDLYGLFQEGRARLARGDTAQALVPLERARRADERESRRQSKGGRATKVSDLALALGKALSHHGRARPSPASIRPTAPSTARKTRAAGPHGTVAPIEG